MCGRYITPDQAALEREWDVAAPAGYSQSFNVAPTQLAPVIRMDTAHALTMDLLVWGFRPESAKRGWINARSETVLTANLFSAAAHKRRCLVPAMGWYEWQGAKAPRQPYVLHLDGFRPFAFAGVWTARRTPVGWELSFAILTRAAAELAARIHDRMPVVLNARDHEAWLAPDTTVDDVRRLSTHGIRGVAAYPISPFVNKPEHDDARCIQPVDETMPESKEPA